MFAVALLYAPLAAAVLLAHGADCCVGGYCNIAAHKHAKQAQKPQPAVAQHPAGMTCEHEGGGSASSSGVTPCTMSCCQDAARPALMPVAFVMPPASFVPALSRSLRAVRVLRAFEISRYVRPLSPPPRSLSSLL